MKLVEAQEKRREDRRESERKRGKEQRAASQIKEFTAFWRQIAGTVK